MLIGIFHHLDDITIKLFLSKTTNFKIISIDAVILPDQNLITKLLFYFDREILFENCLLTKKLLKVLNTKYYVTDI